ncbi:hypothetical protein PIB30_101878 [Stylosanthes scabra]|uniref:Uncharacterized protein n=1 Tax=Stylosanthes scabra TaxID=79078 RepID=A0ABU6YV92_9FABA|nr:hypothetical protein [Stylosanthes scabra]
MKKAIDGRGKKAHLTRVPPTPAETEPSYDQREQADQTVFTWIIQNIEVNVMNKCLNFQQQRHYGTIWQPLMEAQETSPSVESAYVAIRREATRLPILKPTIDGGGDISQGKIGIGIVTTETGVRVFM